VAFEQMRLRDDTGCQRFGVSVEVYFSTTTVPWLSLTGSSLVGWVSPRACCPGVAIGLWLVAAFQAERFSRMAFADVSDV